MAEFTFTPALYLTFISILIITVLLKLRSLFYGHGAGTNLPPGPWPLPIIGNMHCLLGSLPHHAMRALAQRYGPVMLLRLGHVTTVVISSPEAAREIMKTHDAVFASRPLYVTADILTYGGQNVCFATYNSPHWKAVRRLCTTEMLSTRRVLSFRTIREEEAASLVLSVAAAAAAAASAMNVSERVKVVMNDILMRCAIGDRCPMRDEYIAELDMATGLLAGRICIAATAAYRFEKTGLHAGFNLIDLFPGSWLARTVGAASFLQAAMEVHGRLHRITHAIIKHHEAKGGTTTVPVADGAGSRREDFVDILLRFQRDGGLEVPVTSEVVSAVLFDVFAAGSGTSASIAIWAMSELVRSPRVMQRAQSEVRQLLRGRSRVTEAEIQGRLPYLHMVIKETLRLHPPGPLILPRLCAESTKILGFDVLKGTTVFVNVWAIGRDERSWADANEFKPERFEDGTVDINGVDFRFLPGGAGRRMCPGLAFGLAKVEIALASLLYHFDWSLPGGANPCELDMTEAYGLVSRRKYDLWLEAIPCVGNGSESLLP